MSPHQVMLTCPDASGRLVRVTVLRSVDEQVMILGPRGGFRLGKRDLATIVAFLSEPEDAGNTE